METPDLALQAWRVADHRFEEDQTFEEKALTLVRFAMLAPSGHNSQPWLFAIRPGRVDFYADRSRRLPVVDPHDRELIMSVGAAIGTFCVAAHHFGQETTVKPFPSSSQPNLLASVRLRDAPSWDHSLFGAILSRRTTRKAFEKRSLPDELLTALKLGAPADGVEITVVKGDERATIGRLISRGDAIQMADKHFRLELADWIRPNSSDARDGMRGYGLGLSNLMSHAGPFVIRTFDVGKSQGAKDKRLAEGAPMLLILSTSEDTPADWLGAGQALVRVLLRLTAAGATASFLNQAIEVEELRPELTQTANITGFPQLLLRCGYGTLVPAEPRRPLVEVLVQGRLAQPV